MSSPRIFQNQELRVGSTIDLDTHASHHLATVLRAKEKDFCIIFNGKGGEYTAFICAINKKRISVKLTEHIDISRESSLDLILAQGISRGEKMDYTIQKSVELGVKKIIPLFTERSTVKLDKDRLAKKVDHWRSVIISACEQSGRTLIPDIEFPTSLREWMPIATQHQKFILSPHHQRALSNHEIDKNKSVVLLIGPEGGFSDNEIKDALANDFSPLSLGPRVLRTETAGVAALAVMQFCLGDLG